MTLKIARLSTPRLITSDLLQALLQGGELSKTEVSQIADDYNQKSYDDEIYNLCKLTGLCFHYNDVLSLRSDPIINIESEPKRRLRLLSRMPQFRKWLNLHYNNNTNKWHTDKINTSDEDDFNQIKDFRELKFEKWAKNLDSDLTNSLKEYFDNGFIDTVRVNDDCLFYNYGDNPPNQKQAQRITVLLLFLTAKRQGAAIGLEELATLVDQPFETIRDWIVSYFDPIGIPINIRNNNAWITTSIHYEIYWFDSTASLLESAGLSYNVTLEETIEETLLYNFSEIFTQPTGETVNSGSCTMDFPTQLDAPQFSDGGSTSVRELIQQRRETNDSKTNRITVLSIPSEKSLRRPFQSLVKHILESPDLIESVSEPEWELGHLFRERYRHAGSVPLFKASKPGDLTKLGNNLQRDGVTQSELRCLMFVSNPLIRTLVVLVGMSQYTVRIEDGTWQVIYDDTTKNLVELLSQILTTVYATETVISPTRDDAEASRRLVAFAEKIKIVDQDQITQSLDLPQSVLNELTTYDLLDWHDDIRSAILDITPNKLKT